MARRELVGKAGVVGVDPVLVAVLAVKFVARLPLFLAVLLRLYRKLPLAALLAAAPQLYLLLYVVLAVALEHSFGPRLLFLFVWPLVALLLVLQKERKVRACLFAGLKYVLVAAWLRLAWLVTLELYDVLVADAAFHLLDYRVEARDKAVVQLLAGAHQLCLVIRSLVLALVLVLGQRVKEVYRPVAVLAKK